MLKAEAEWIGAQLQRIGAAELSPLLNAGSASAEFREKVQPWIDSCIFAPLRERGVAVQHLDLFPGPGVDLCGDLTEESFARDIASRGFRAVLCCNMLEHVTDREFIARTLQALTPVGGYILITVPHSFPYHPDPIDTMYRPGVEEVATLFSSCEVAASAVLNCGTGWDYVGKNLFTIIGKVAGRLVGGNHGGVKGSSSFAPWLFRQFRETCVLFRRVR